MRIFSVDGGSKKLYRVNKSAVSNYEQEKTPKQTNQPTNQNRNKKNPYPNSNSNKAPRPDDKLLKSVMLISLSNCISERLADSWSKPTVLEEKELLALGSVSENVTKNSERVKKFQISLLKNEICIRNATPSSISNGGYENMILKIIYLGDF